MRSVLRISSMRTRLLLIVSAVLLVAMGLLSGLSYYFANQFLARSNDEVAKAISSECSQKVTEFMAIHIVQLEGLAASNPMRSGDAAQIVESMAEAHKRLGIFDLISYVSLDGATRRFDGNSGINLGDREYFKKVIVTKKPFVSQPVVSRVTGKMAVIIAVPILDGETVKGVLVGNLSVGDQLNQALENVRFKESGYGFLVDNAGVLIAHPRRSELIGRVTLGEGKRDIPPHGDAGELDSRLGKLFATAAAENKQRQGVFKMFDEIESIGVITPIDLAGGQRWSLIVAAPVAEARRDVDRLSQIMLAISLGSILFAAVITAYISKQFSKPIMQLRDEAVLMARGNLEQRSFQIDAKDEIKELSATLFQMADSLRNMIADVKAQATIIAAGSGKLANGTTEATIAANQVAQSIVKIAEGSEQQSTDVARILEVVDNVAANTRQIAVTVKGIAEDVAQTTQMAKRGKQVADTALDKMKQIRQGSEEIRLSIQELAKGAQGIQQIVELIASIAQQTNLIALNAAIEAARAGEHGRGFTVVADEVRRLSEGTSQATQRIVEVIKQNRKDMEKAAAAIHTGSQCVEQGTEVVGISDELFTQIADSICRLSEQISTMTATVEQNDMRCRGMVDFVRQIDATTANNAAEAQTVSAAAEELTALLDETLAVSSEMDAISRQLQGMVGNFKV